MATPWRRWRARGAVVAALALIAAVVAGFARRVVFDAQADPSAMSDAAAVEIYPRSPWTRPPAILSGADRGTTRAVTFHLHPPPAGRLILSLDLAPPPTPAASPAAPQLIVEADGTAVATANLAAGGGPARRRRHRLRIPAGVFGEGSSGQLSLVNATGGTVTLQRARLVEARPSFALRHLGRRGRLPLESTVLLAASLVALLAWRPAAGESAGRRMVRTSGAAAALGLLALGAALPGHWTLAGDVPRWLWLSAPWLLLLLGLQPSSRNPGVRARAWLANGLMAVLSLVVTVVGAELVLRFVYRHVSSAADTRTYFARRQAEQNSLGFREREFPLVKPAGTYRIAVVGDSLAWGIGVSPGERFSGQLERALNAGRRSGPTYEVLNFSRAGWDTADELDALRAVVLRASPDFVILQWYVNDFENGMRVERPRPAPLVPWESLRFRLFHSSALYSAVEEKSVRLQEWLGLLETYPEYMYRRFGDPRSPHSAGAIASLQGFLTECRRREVRMTVLLFPHAGPDLAGGRYEYDYLHDRVMETCGREGIGCVDLRRTFAAHADYRRLWVSPLDPHPSALAHRLAAERLLEDFAWVWRGDVRRRS